MTNSEIPDGWAMPDDLAKKISERLNRKTLRPEDELADALEEMVRDNAMIEPDPRDWGWISYLLVRADRGGRSEARKGFRIYSDDESFTS